LAVTKEKKDQLLEQYKDMLADAHISVVAGYQGLKMAEMTALRNQLRPLGVEMHVVKNTLARLALSRLGVTTPETLWQEANAIAVSKQDVAAAAKALVAYAKNEQRFVIKAGVLGKQTISAEQVGSLADLPSREVLLGRVLGGIQAPITGLVTVLGGVSRSLVNVLDARRRQLQEAEG